MYKHVILIVLFLEIFHYIFAVPLFDANVVPYKDTSNQFTAKLPLGFKFNPKDVVVFPGSVGFWGGLDKPLTTIRYGGSGDDAAESGDDADDENRVTTKVLSITEDDHAFPSGRNYKVDVDVSTPATWNTDLPESDIVFVEEPVIQSNALDTNNLSETDPNKMTSIKQLVGENLTKPSAKEKTRTSSDALNNWDTSVMASLKAGSDTNTNQNGNWNKLAETALKILTKEMKNKLRRQRNRNKHNKNKTPSKTLDDELNELDLFFMKQPTKVNNPSKIVDNSNSIYDLKVKLNGKPTYLHKLYPRRQKRSLFSKDDLGFLHKLEPKTTEVVRIGAHKKNGEGHSFNSWKFQAWGKRNHNQ